MVPWDSAPVSQTFRQRCRQALGNFFRAFQKDEPRWVSLLQPVTHDDKTCLYYILGFDTAIRKEFLCSTGLIRVGHSQNPTATIVIKAEWDKFLIEEKLHDLMERVNQSLMSG